MAGLYHLGRSTNSGTVVLLNETNSGCPATGFVVLNTQTLTAANGDQVFLTNNHLPPLPGRWARAVQRQ